MKHKDLGRGDNICMKLQLYLLKMHQYELGKFSCLLMRLLIMFGNI